MIRRVVRSFLCASLLFLFLCLFYVQAATKSDSKSPAPKPEKLAPGVISTDSYEMNAAFTPDEETIYFVRAKDVQLSSVAIYVSHKIDGKWGIPEIAEFSGKYYDMDPFISPDGKRFYFTSNRPLEGKDGAKSDFDIWVMEKTDSGWGPPRNIGGPVNTDKSETHPVVAANGNLYFASRDTPNNWNIYRAVLKDNAYQKPEKMSREVNSGAYNFEPFIDPRERYIIFSQYNFDQNDDQFVSYNLNGSWTEAKLLPFINTVNFEICPYVNRDEKTFFFTRAGDIYQIDFRYFNI